MFADLTSWDLVSLISKLCWYFGVIAATGGTFSVWLLADHSRRGLQWSLFYSLAGALLGFHAVIFYFLAQVGAANDSGLGGMFDWNMIRLYLDLGVGETSLLRMGVFLLLVVGQIVGIVYLASLSRPPGQTFFRLFYRLNAAALLLLMLSFQATGHVAPLSFAARIAVVLHVLCVALWLGSLLPLLRSTGAYEPLQVQRLMKQFSRHATIMVGVLLLAALYLVTRLLGAAGELVTTPYGITLLLKVAVVLALLALAALNRWQLVPALDKPGGVQRLRRSIQVETAVGLLVLAVTVYLSTVIGPASHGG